MLNGLIKHLKQGLLSENHRGFQANRGIVGMIFATRPAGAKHLDSYTTFVDLTKAFERTKRGYHSNNTLISH